MSPPLGHVEEGLGKGVPSLISSASSENLSNNNSGLREHNYMGLSDASSLESSVITCPLEEKEDSLNLKETELRLGLPGSRSPVRDPELCLLPSLKLDEKALFPLAPLKENTSEEKNGRNGIFSGNKRGFSDAIDDGFLEAKGGVFSEGFLASVGVNAVAVKQGSATWHTGGLDHRASGIVPSRPPLSETPVMPVSLKDQSPMLKEVAPPKMSQDRVRAPNEPNQTNPVNNYVVAPASKQQVVGWPPIRSFRKNTLAANPKNNEEVDGKPGFGGLFVKVSMDGAPYLRKVDLKTYSAYQELSTALEKMFSCFTIGQCGSHGVSGRDGLSESKLKDLLNGSEYVLTYEDKDGDWMLVGDVPWEMFIDSCKRLRIMKGSDAIGLAPRAMEKCRNRN
ncbi:hypothetical protein AMTRI_Chr13g89800 [Amborella trichopoda]|uniref:Auxin-responsive protein n=1 Tax=Amborella trichopoda TaxID=13333 RepID=W1PPK3_AMBTC|nr:auxin-responsive protein IAA9 [Amborella trichopoda]XP_011625576.1 auxin-responsive protein IAA9 [Amborella trichopoda]XP_011625577.1 auxin-responsive protein IAA9 [Amborella trichopoda]XP_011625578.1 auxin-responsive protein IAA9 [Amborella trichopoda]ERN11962.1 hypothetical protein AMTR_s00184p00030540 [Amborella trichopoda]|eukprot:XP_006850381.1 auxin-responsive protein IAA9 [Amborella trichopoda]